MASLNKIMIIGNVGKEPKITDTQGGKSIASFSIACAERWLDKASGERKEKTEWLSIVVYNDSLVGVVKQYIKKGSKVYVEGSLCTRKYTDKSGIERYVTEVVLQAFNGKLILLDGKTEEQKSAPVKQSAPVDDEIDDGIPF